MLFGVVLVAGPLQAQKIKLTVPVPELEARAQRDSNDAAAHYNLAMGYLSKDALVRRRPPCGRPSHWTRSLPRPTSPCRSPTRRMETSGGRSARRARTAFARPSGRSSGNTPRPFSSTRWWTCGSSAASSGFGPGGSSRAGLKDLVEGKYPTAYTHFSNEVRHQQKGGKLEDVPQVLLWFRSLAAAHSELPDSAAADLLALVARTERQVAVDSAPDDAPLRANEYRYMLAAIRQRQGRTAEATELYQETITADIGLYMAHVQLAGSTRGRQGLPACGAGTDARRRRQPR